MWICSAQYQHYELHQLSEVALIAFTTLPTSGPVLRMPVLQGMQFHGPCLQTEAITPN